MKGQLLIMKRFNFAIAFSLLLASYGSTVRAEQFELLTGVDHGLAPGGARFVTSQLGQSVPFFDGDRLAGTAGTTPTAWLGNAPAPFYSTNQFGSLSFMFRRGTLRAEIPGPQPQSLQIPIQAIEYLGGPRLDLDGDLNNGQRSLARPVGATPAPISGIGSYIDLGIDRTAATLSLDGFDATGTNAGSDDLSSAFGVTTNVLAGTQSNGAQTGAINPTFDTRQGGLTDIAPGITRVNDLGYEFWQDGIAESSTPETELLGSFQYLGGMRGWMIERDGVGNFPALTGLLGGTLWSTINTADLGAVINTPSGGTATILDGAPDDQFSLSPEGLPTGDLGAYLDQVVVPLIDPAAQRFVYLESSGIGNSNSIDPVFKPTNGYDVVLIAQSVPEPATGLLLFAAASIVAVRRRRA